MRNFPFDVDTAYDKVTIDGETYYGFHALVRENPNARFDVDLLKTTSDLNEQAVWKIVTLGYFQVIYYHSQVWEEEYPDAILPK